jgi:hypothetical protein
MRVVWCAALAVATVRSGDGMYEMAAGGGLELKSERRSFFK